LAKRESTLQASRHRRIDTRVFASAQETGRESSVTTHAPAVGAHCADQSFVHQSLSSPSASKNSDINNWLGFQII
jgi:hypothetical protein